MIKRHSPAACCVFLLLFLFGIAHAQDTSRQQTTGDVNAQQDLKNNGVGVLFLETVFSERGMESCPEMQVFLARLGDGKKAEARTRFNSPLAQLFGKSLGGVVALAPGDHVVTGIRCGKANINGPHARFQIRAGEIINAGAIKLVVRGYEGDFIITGVTLVHRSIERLSPETIAYFKKEYPQTFARAVSRPMSLVGSADVKYKGRL